MATLSPTPSATIGVAIPIKFVGLGEKADDLQPFDPKQFAQALFEE
jgi:signal recognition particle GTPase